MWHYPRKRFSPAFYYALTLVEHMGDGDIAVVPVVPTAAMLESGVRAGSTSPCTVARIYTAMIKATQ